MALTVTSFRSIFPDEPFASVSDAKVESYIEVALKIHTRDELATLYCTAHLLALDIERDEPTLEPDGGAGVVESEGIGPRQIGYVTQATGDKRRAFFAPTTYGRTFLVLEERHPKVALGTLVA